MMLFNRRKHRRPRGIIGRVPLLAIIIIVFAISPSYPFFLPLLSRSSPPSSSSSSSSSRSIFLVEATKVTWTGNDGVLPEHEDAHNAPRSQKYWDEHGIRRPDYAKTDAEIAAERRGSSGPGGGGIVGRRIGLVLLAAASAAAAAVGIVAILFAMANATGRLDGIISNHPAGARVARFAKWMTEASAGWGGSKLGGSSSSNAATRGGEEEARRIARLARFDNPRNMLDDMKMD